MPGRTPKTDWRRLIDKTGLNQPRKHHLIDKQWQTRERRTGDEATCGNSRALGLTPHLNPPDMRPA